VTISATARTGHCFETCSFTAMMRTTGRSRTLAADNMSRGGRSSSELQSEVRCEAKRSDVLECGKPWRSWVRMSYGRQARSVLIEHDHDEHDDSWVK
jgi:hypothetical protein